MDTPNRHVVIVLGLLMACKRMGKKLTSVQNWSSDLYSSISGMSDGYGNYIVETTGCLEKNKC